MSNKKHDYDVIVIGAGPAGYAAATRAAQLGLKTACIDNWANKKKPHCLGGSYVNGGCISVVALLESAKLFHKLNHGIADHGISASNIQADIPRMQRRKESIIDALNQQIKNIFSNNKVEPIHAHAQLINPNRVEITPINGGIPQVITANKIILAAGSSATQLSFASIDNEFIIDPLHALNLQSIPQTLGIIGAGAIGIELAGIWNKLGTKVTLFEAQDTFMNMADHQIADEAFKLYSLQGLDIRLSSRVISTNIAGQKVTVEYEDKQGRHQRSFDKLIVASGRKPNTETLIAASADLLLDEEGFVHVDKNCCSTLPGVYAIGDLTLSGPMLAHKGIEEGIFVAEHIAGQYSPINYHTIPNVIYTDPEIAWVGQSEQDLLAIGENIKISSFPFSSTGRAQIMGTTEGMVKVIMHAETELILGVHIIGHLASELIAEAVLAMEFSATAEDLARTIHAHPTLSEAMHESALELNARSLHITI
ncbi:MAG: dihydrolipoyl dehydrogenase [Methyloprofundus sp.]|nr:dihydrolipoyl dehydrogenase [Methyloprofundus sp.]MDT8424738.1 dihydrolipoyl dehydrogenase [Methyloprofundus sp.]